jgi:hypothetical protein
VYTVAVRRVVLLSLVACGGSEPVEFPSVLAPLSENRAEWPAASGGRFPEEPNVVSGGDDSLWWAHARGYVEATPREAWDFAMDAETVLDRREIDAWEITEEDTREDVDESMTILCTVEDFLTIEYDLVWVYELQAGTEQAPERVVAQWDVTGTPFIEILEGSMVIEPDPNDPSVSRVEYVEHLKAALRDDETIASYLRDLHASLVARAQGEPLPDWTTP